LAGKEVRTGSLASAVLVSSVLSGDLYWALAYRELVAQDIGEDRAVSATVRGIGCIQNSLAVTDKI